MKIEIGWQNGDSPLALPAPYCTPRHTLVERELAEMATSPAWCRDITPETRLVAPPAATPRFSQATPRLQAALAALVLVIDQDVRRFNHQVAGIPFEAIVARVWAHVLEGGLNGRMTQVAIDHGPPLLIPTVLSREERADPDLFEVPDLMPVRLARVNDALKITLPGPRACGPLAKERELASVPIWCLIVALEESLKRQPRSDELSAWMVGNDTLIVPSSSPS